MKSSMAWTNSWNKCHAPSPNWSLLLGIRRFIVVSKRLVTEIAYDRVYHIRDDNQKSMFEQPFQSLPEKLRPYLTAPKNLIIGGWRWLLSVGGPKKIVCSGKEPHWSNHPCCIADFFHLPSSRALEESGQPPCTSHRDHRGFVSASSLASSQLASQ